MPISGKAKEKKAYIKEELKKKTTIDKKEIIRQAKKCANRFRYEEALQKLEILEQDPQVTQLRLEIINKMNR